MNDAPALAEIKLQVARNNVRFKYPHAYDRMSERGATKGDVLNAIATSTCAEFQPNGRHKVTGGVDFDGDDMTVIVYLAADVLVVTLF